MSDIYEIVENIVFLKSFMIKILMNAAIMIAALLLGGCGDNNDASSPAVVRIADECTLGNIPCAITMPGITGQIHLDRQPKYLQPFGTIVSLHGSDADQVQSVTVRLNMTGMDMSLPANRLHKTVSGYWQGELMVPICSSGRSDWMVEVEINITSGGRYVARFDLEVR